MEPIDISTEEDKPGVELHHDEDIINQMHCIVQLRLL
jgi:hypothetical protein